MTALLRSNIEFAKRVFLDRLTTDAQPLLQPANIDAGPGDEYDYAGVFNPYNFGIGADCSGLCGIVLGAAINGAAGMSWSRLFSTETFPGPLPGFRRTTQADLIRGAYPLKVCIMHGGGGPDSHMACQIDGWDMESNGGYGVCTKPPEITGIASNYWNDWWVWDGPITEDTAWRQPMGYPQGLDYAGGYISGADLAAAGISFVCRYINDGGAGLPKKLLTADEFIDLCHNGIQVVFNYETTATFMLTDNGAADAQQGLNYVRSLLDAAAAAGIDTAGYKPVIYFSADFDEAPSQDATIEAYLDAAKSVLGVNAAGKSCAAMYGAYWILMRAHNSGHVDYLWQTEAWSGGYIDSDIAVMQRNNVGYTTIGGVQCDVNEAHTDDFGQFIPNQAPAPAPAPTPGGPVSNPPAIPKPTDGPSELGELWDQLLLRWDMLNDRTLVEAVAEIGAKLGLPYTPPGGNA